MKTLIALLVLLWATTAGATTYYVTKAGGGSTCSIGSPCLTIAIGIGKLASGDTLEIGAGTYDERINFNSLNVPSGTSWSSPTTIKAAAGASVIVLPSSDSSTPVLNITDALNSNPRYIIFQDLIFDGTHVTSGESTLGTFGNIDHIRFQGGEIRNTGDWGHGGLIVGGFHEFINVKVHGNGIVLDPANSNHAGYGLYITSDDALYEHLEVYGNGAYGLHVYNVGGGVNRNVLRYNSLHDNGVALGKPAMILSSGDDNRAYGNIIYNTPNNGVKLEGGTNTKLWNNTIANNTNYGIEIQSPGTGTIVKNNIIYGNGDGAYLGSSGNITSATNLCASGCEVTGNPQFVNGAGGNFSLAASSAAINVGTVAIATGITACANGSAPDIGAIETLGAPTATVNTTAAKITIPNNCTEGRPVLPATSVTGWTFKKNGSSDAVVSNDRASTNLYGAVLTSAFAGGDTCLFSYSQTGNSTSDNNIGNVSTSNQEVLAFTDAACTNLTSGGGPTLAYHHGRWYLLQGAVDTAWVPIGAENADVTVPPGAKLNLRWKIQNSAADTSFNPRVYVQYDGGGYVTLTNAFVNGVKALGNGSQLGTVMSEGSPMTQDQLQSDVGNIACTYIRSAAASPTLVMATNTEAECGQAIEWDTTAVAGKQYDFKIDADGGGGAVSGGPISAIIGSYQSVR